MGAPNSYGDDSEMPRRTLRAGDGYRYELRDNIDNGPKGRRNSTTGIAKIITFSPIKGGARRGHGIPVNGTSLITKKKPRPSPLDLFTK